MRLAEFAVRSGEFVAAKKYIAEVLKHCNAYGDNDTAWFCQLLTGWMLFLEGEPKQASRFSNQCHVLESLTWCMDFHWRFRSALPSLCCGACMICL